MCDALSHLHDMEASVFNIMNHLITQVNNIDSPDSRENTFAILEPLNDSALDFITPVVNAWSDTTVVKYFARHLCPPLETYFESDRYQSVRWNTQRAREVLPYLDATIVRIEADGSATEVKIPRIALLEMASLVIAVARAGESFGQPTSDAICAALLLSPNYAVPRRH